MCPHDRPVAVINLSPGDPSSGFYGIREHVSVGVRDLGRRVKDSSRGVTVKAL